MTNQENPQEINIADFDGPLDLLLHLITENRVDLVHLSLIQTIDKYLAVIRANENNLDKLSEFVVMAATLLYLKTQLLLPDEEDAEDEENAKETLTELKKRLIDYNKYKLVSQKLDSQLEGGQKRFYRAPLVLNREVAHTEAELEELFYGMNAAAIGRIYKSVFERHAFAIDEDKAGNHLVHREKISLNTAAERVMDFVTANPTCYFDEMITEDMGNEARIAEFLATLELAKAGVLTVYHETDEDFETGRLLVHLQNIDAYKGFTLKDPEK